MKSCSQSISVYIKSNIFLKCFEVDYFVNHSYAKLCLYDTSKLMFEQDAMYTTWKPHVCHILWGALISSALDIRAEDRGSCFYYNILIAFSFIFLPVTKFNKLVKSRRWSCSPSDMYMGRSTFKWLERQVITGA